LAYNEPRLEDQPKPFDRLLSDTFRLYRKGFRPFFTIVVTASLVANTIGLLWGPSGAVFAILWSFIPLVPLLIANVASITVAWQVRSDQPPSLKTAVGVAFNLAPRYIGASFLIITILFVLIAPLTFLAEATGIVFLALPSGAIAVFLLTRWAFFGPILVVESTSISGALNGSWLLVRGRTWRTLGMLFSISLAVLFSSTVLMALLGPNASVPAIIILASVAQAITLPVATVFLVLLYEDYRSLEASPLPSEPSPPDP
jgi:hypothetical protein